MAGTSVLKLKVDDKEYNSSLKQAQQGMQHLEQALKDAGKSFTQVDKSVVNYVRGIGQMEAQSKTARGRISEMSNAFVELSLQYKNMSDEVKSGDVGKALAESMVQLKQRTIDAKNELKDIQKELDGGSGAGGGFLSGLGSKMSGALQVFGGNLMTKGAGMLAGLASEMGDMVKQGVELARQGEGIRNAFERLGRGDLLDGLREATHGTVTDLELMKAAVKFNDFKLPLDELGTMLAFAQQKAKDTGQSVDYMVDSIVTGLGRKSLMILDNLGLSATEIRDKMKETGDMTKAVGAIIREQMQKAGDYVETAADRATKANVELENAMTRLGETFQPLTGAANSMWNNIKIGALDLLNNAVKPLIQALAEAGALGSGARATAGYNSLGGGSKVDRMIGMLGNGKTAGAYRIYQKQLEEFDKYINNKRFQIAAFGNDNSSIAQSAKQRLQTQLDGALKMRAEYVKRAQELHNKVPSPYEPAKTSGGATGGGGGKGGKTIVEEKDDFKEVEEIVGLLNLQKQKLDDLQAMKPFAETEDEIVRLNKEIEKANTEYQRLLNLGKEKPIEIATGTSIQNDAGMSAYIASIKQQLETADYGTSLYNGLSAQLADMTTLQNLVGESLRLGLGTAMFDVADETGADFWTRAMEGGVENIDWKTIVDKINEARKAAGLDVISIDFTSGSVNSKDKKEKDGLQDSKTMLNAISQLTSGLQSIGIEIPKEIQSVISVIQGVMQVIEAVNTIIGGGQTAALTANTVAMGALTSALWANTTASWIPFAGGGIVPHFAEGGLIGKAALGMTIPGNSFSGDNLRMPVVGGGMIGLNSGELILNRVQQGVLADALSEPPSGIQGGNPYVSGENIFLGINNYLHRAGYGELVTTKR